MKRDQIRRLIPIPVSDAQLRRAIANLGLPAEDDHDYSAENTQAILNQFAHEPPKQTGSWSSAPLPTASSQALTQRAIGQSTEALTGQVKALATRMDAGDRSLARQLAEYVVERPQRFTVMFAQELSALMAPFQDCPQTFVDGELAVVEIPDLRGEFLAIAPSTPMGCLPIS